jgi:c(7)-type cytochrome triheme protein
MASGTWIRWLQAVVAAAAFGAWAAQAQAPTWLPLERGGVHDPKNPGLRLLQQPAEALAPLPRDTAGNGVNWVKAIESGAITPRSSLQGDAPMVVRDDALIIAKYGSMPAVKFPHRAHTLWLDCANCHEKLFVSKAGANRFSMLRILEGEQCGVCHGAVAFPLTECNRCHSVPNASIPRSPPR